MKSWEWERIYRREEREAGRTEGRKEGQFYMLCEMVQEERISIEEAARKANMTAEEFTDKMADVMEKV